MTVRTRALIGGSLVALAAAGCGSKGPPLPPLRPVPEAPSGLVARRMGDRVTLNLRVPGASADPTTEMSIAGVEIYALTLPFGSEVPTVAQLLHRDNLVGTIEVRPAPAVVDEGAPAPPTPVGPSDPRPAAGDLAVWSETIPSAAPRPLELNRQQQARVASQRTLWMPLRPSGLVVPATRVVLPTRYYVAVGVSNRRRPGPASPIAAVPFGPAPDAPDLKVPTYTETELTLSWTTRAPGMPVTIVETTRAGVEQPAPVEDVPVTTGSWSTPVEFGTERCFVVRGVVRRGAASIESATVGPVCATPVDTFAPAAPTGLVAVSDPDGVTLLWDQVSASDLAGYLVLRAEGTSETVQELTPKPMASLQYVDNTVRAGVRYVYFVVAVDAAGNRSPRSNPANR